MKDILDVYKRQVIMWLFVGETRGLDLKTVTGTEWDKPKKVKEEQQDGE